MKTVLLASHDSGTPGGPVDKLTNFLKNYNLIIVKHPLSPSSQVKSIIRSKRINEEFKIRPSVQYFYEGYLTSKKISSYLRKPVDLSICFDPLSFFNIYLFNHVYKSKKIIYYNLDYSEKRFSNPAMNSVYIWMHKFAYKKSNYFFSLREGVREKVDPENNNAYKNFVVGQTVKIKKVKSKKIPGSLVYAGATGKSIDFLPLFKALANLKNNNIFFMLDIFGEENDQLTKIIKKFSLNSMISVKKPLNSDVLTETILPRYKIGLSPYKTKKNIDAPDYLFQGRLLSAKVVDYIAANMPVIATKINPEFDVIEKNHFGFLAETESEWENALKTLLVDDKTYKEYQRNASRYALKFDEIKIFGNALKKVL